MSDDKGYKDKREFTCTGCGKKIMLTKFASQKTCKCDECKANGVQTNQQIVEEALKNMPAKKSRQKSTGATKTCKCIKCGIDVEVSKFMSADKVLCPECKGTGARAIDFTPKVDLSKLDKSKLLPIEEYEVNDLIIQNKRLREVKCPACGHEYMKPLMIVDWSQFGLIIDYQCHNCFLKMTISEQCNRKLNIYSPGKRFDYTGEEIRGIGITYAEHSRIVNSLRKLIGILDEHDIQIDDEFKPYRWKNEKPVPIGYEIPSEDIFVKTIHEVIEKLKNADEVVDTTELADKLEEILKGDNDNAEST